MSKDDDAVPLSAKAVAHACGITPRRLSQLVSEGTVTRLEDGFTLAAVRQYVQWLKRDEQTRAARRELLGAQTASVRARTSTLSSITPDDCRARLERPISQLFGIRNAASWQRSRLLAAGIDPTLADRLSRELWAELAGLAAGLRRQFDAAFPPSASVPADE